MTYTTLVAPKGTAGSIAAWVNYAKLDLPTILEEAQSLLYSMLRVREMRTEWTFQVAAGFSEVALPERFLDPDSPIMSVADQLVIDHRTEQDVLQQRIHEEVFGSLDGDPVATTAGSALVTIAAANHGLTQGSTVSFIGVAAVGGLTLDGAYPVVAILDADHFQINAGSEATATASGGGNDASFAANRLIDATPSLWAVWDEAVKFDCAFEAARTCKLIYFRRPALLSPTNPTNFLTQRYPRLLRTACQAMAADFMKDTNEYTKALTALQALVQSTAAEGDLMYRGAIFGTRTP